VAQSRESLPDLEVRGSELIASTTARASSSLTVVPVRPAGIRNAAC
jgi:hypothetical protein